MVTGAASGIGLAMARLFSDEGMNVVAADVDAAALERLQVDPGFSSPVRTVPTDVSGSFLGGSAGRSGVSGVRRGGHPVQQRRGRAQWEPSGRLISPSGSGVLGVNLWGVINGIRSFVPRMLGTGLEGHVVNTASMAGLIAGREMTPWRLGRLLRLQTRGGFHHPHSLRGTAHCRSADRGVAAVPRSGEHPHLGHRAVAPGVVIRVRLQGWVIR